jgi:hypothetical protein
MRPSEIFELVISLKIGDRATFDLLLRRDGSISRLGSGDNNNPDANPYRGKVGPFFFRRLLEHLPSNWTLPFGQYETKEKRGGTCELALMFLSQDQIKKEGYYFRYGAESQGPPLDVMRFLLEAKNATDDWYREQQAVGKKSQV